MELIDDVLKLIPKDKVSQVAPVFTALGILIKVGQIVYGWIQKKSQEHQRSSLMEEMKRTTEILAELSKPEAQSGNSGSTDALRTEAQRHLSELRHRLADTFHTSKEEVKPAASLPRRHWVRRAVLLYLPQNRAAWLPQLLAMGELVLRGHHAHNDGRRRWF